MNDFLEVAHKIQGNDENIGKASALFSYPIDRDATRPLFVEIGGPSTHAKIYPRNETEKEVLRKAIMTILNGREIEYETELTELCRNKLGARK